MNIAPLKTVTVTADKAQAAIDGALPGTEIRVTGKGTTPLRLKSGTPEAPIFLIGDGAEITLPGSSSASCISAWRQSNFVIAGFKTVGGFHGILCGEGENFLIVNNDVSGVGEDGIKVTHSKNTVTRANKVYDCVEEGIDHVECENALIEYNEVFNIQSPAGGIFAKSGSKGVRLYRNYVHDCKADGICLGGQGGSTTPITWTTQFEDGSAIENKIERVGENPINLKGAVNSKVLNNYCSANPSYFSSMVVGSGYHLDRSKTPNVKIMMYSRNVEIAGNLLLGRQNITVQAGSNIGINIHDNPTEGAWDVAVGPSAIPPWAPSAPLPTTDPRIAELETSVAALIVELQSALAALESVKTRAVQAEAELVAATAVIITAKQALAQYGGG